MPRPLALLLAASLILPAAASERSPQVLYMLNCQGCHLPDGRGMEGKVPDMRGMLGRFQAVEGGRDFIVRVPGTSNSKLDDHDVARLLNWLVPAMGPRDDGFKPYTAQEVHALRADKLSDVAATRARLMSEIGEETPPDPRDMLHWDQATRTVGFRTTYKQYPGTVLHPGARPFPLPEAARKLTDVTYRFGERDHHLADYLADQSVTGLLVLKDGRIAYEYYGRGNRPDSLWTSRSVAKSIVSVLVGVALEDGAIKSVNDPVTDYLPELKNTAWDGVTLHQLLQHSSGTAWNEDYLDPNSDFEKMTQCEAGPAAYDCLFALIAGVKRAEGVKPGEKWSYNTGGAWLVGRVLERATGHSIARYMEKKVWQPFGMEHEAVWESLQPGRIDFGGHGFNATLRDWGRFAELVLRNGRLADGTALLPDDWMRRSTDWTRAAGSVTPQAPDGQYGYQWWNNEVGKGGAFPDKAFAAEGIYGQAIMLNPAEHLAVIQWSVWKQAEEPASLYDEQALFFQAVAQRLETGTAPAEAGAR